MRGTPRFAAILLAGALSLSAAAAVSAANAAKARQPGRIAAAISPAWFSRLSLTPDQQTKVQAANETLRADLQKVRNLTSPDEKKAALREARQTYRQTIQAALTPAQVTQLESVMAAARQFHALGPVGVRLATLNLTDAQEGKIKEIAAKYQPDIARLHASLKDAADKKSVRDQIHELQQKIVNEVKAVLTPEQVAQLQPAGSRLKASR